MDHPGAPIHPMEEIAAALRSLARAPFLVILLLEVLLVAAGARINDLLGPQGGEDYPYLVFTSGVFFAGATIYLQIATTMAAGSGGAAHGADAWIKAALKQRCFWRYVAVSILAAILTLLGAIALVVGALVVGAAVVLSDAAVVLEKRHPVDALRRSVELTKRARAPVTIIFGVLWFPPFVAAIGSRVWDVGLEPWALLLIDLGSSVLGLAATVAVTRVFVKLGGAPTPPLQTLLYKANARASDNR